MERSPYRHVPKVGLDATDRRILNALQDNCRLTNLELADLVGVSPPTCLRRVRRLRKMKLIMREVAILDTDRIRDSLTAVVPVSLKEEVRSAMAALEAEFRLCTHLYEDGEFIEGVRALLVDKDRKPRWRHARLEDVTSADVERLFAPVAGEPPVFA